MTTFYDLYTKLIAPILSTIVDCVGDITRWLSLRPIEGVEQMFNIDLPDWLPDVPIYAYIFGGAVFFVLVLSFIKWLTAPIT